MNKFLFYIRWFLTWWGIRLFIYGQLRQPFKNLSKMYYSETEMLYKIKKKKMKVKKKKIKRKHKDEIKQMGL